MLSPIGERGSSDAYGSWKMICIRRRKGLSSRARELGDVRAVEDDLPVVGSIRRRRSRPTVVLPQPDSPTRPTVSPRFSEKSTPSTARDLRYCAAQDAALDREALAQAAHSISGWLGSTDRRDGRDLGVQSSRRSLRDRLCLRLCIRISQRWAPVGRRLRRVVQPAS